MPATCSAILLHVAPVTLEQPLELAFGRIVDRAGLPLEAVQVGAEIVVETGMRRFEQAANAFGILGLSWWCKSSLMPS